MKRLKVTLMFVPIFLILSSCQKVKLENNERGQQLLGKWRFSKAVHTTNSNYFSQIEAGSDFRIEFMNDGEFNLNGNIYNVKEFGATPLTFTYGAWVSRMTIEKGDESHAITLHYFGDSILVTSFPFEFEFNSHRYNMYYRK
jgi:hypothetical protein